MIHRLLNIQTLTKRVGHGFSQALFSKKQQKETPGQPKKILFTKLQSNQVAQPEDPKSKFTPTETLDYLVNKINEVNNFYLGVRYNTKYLKVNRLIKYEEAALLTASNVNLVDYPIELSSRAEDTAASFQGVDQNQVLARKAAQIAFTHCRLAPIISKIQELASNYVLSLASDQRFKGLQPNFELQNIKIRNAFKDRVKLTLKNEDSKPEIKIKDITLFKGVGVIRNNNYSTDSYFKDESELSDGFVKYALYRQQKERYPEAEWLTTKFINARFEILVRGGPAIELRQNGQFLGSTQHLLHTAVVQADLIPPPAISEHQLTPEQYLRSYRLVASRLTLTNFDRKNQFFPLTYTQAEKKELLYNGFE